MLSILDLAHSIGLTPKKTASDEYHCACPACGTGVDRLALWPAKDRYWCRRCGVSGDGVQFCRDYLRMSYKEACDYIGKDSSREYQFFIQPKRDEIKEARKPAPVWQEKALAFVKYCSNFLHDPEAQKLLKPRGIHVDTAQCFSLGYNPRDWYRPAQSWGLESRGPISLPAGLVVPLIALDTKTVQGIKIRRLGNLKRKYHHVAGSSDALPVFGYKEQAPLVVLESELDAVLLMQEVGDLIWCIATGGASKKPDINLDRLIKQSPLLIHCPDFDEPGLKAVSIWQNYPQYLRYPTPFAKSVGDAHLQGLSLRDWIIGALKTVSPSGLQRKLDN